MKALLLAAVMATSLVAPAIAGPPARPTCVTAPSFLRALRTLGDPVFGIRPKSAAQADITGILYRHAGYMLVAVFNDGCLRTVVRVARAMPDIQV